MAISSQSISLADTFLGILLIKIRENICLWELVLNYPFCFFAPGATVDTVLDGVNAKPDLFPENTRDVPDINFFYRYSKII